MPVFSITTKTTLLVEGTRIDSFESITLRQSIHDSHEFRVTFEHDSVEALKLLFPSVLTQFARKSIDITVQGDPSAPALEFKGVITRVDLQQRDDAYWGRLTLIGHGQAESLRHVPGTATFMDKPVIAIVNESLTTYTFPKKVLPPAGPTLIPFCVRYRESTWDFLKRMAYDFGAWFYYDGTTLQFTAQPIAMAPITLTFGANLVNFRSGSRAKPTFFKHYDYLPLLDMRLESESPADLAPYLKPVSAGTANPHPAQSMADMAPFKDNRKAALGSEETFMEGKALVTNVFPGQIVTVKDSALGSGGSSAPHIVTDVTHFINGVGQYHNRFQAIPADVVAMPVRNLKRPMAETQIGTVMDNKDPNGMGRVRVQMLWMTAPEKTPFIRMTMPSFGLNNLMARNRGFVFVPAIKDQVMVGFEHNDPERPFVIGAIPHGMNAAIDVVDPEKEKHISVGSGSTLTFIEEIAKKEILLQVDPMNFVKISVPMGIGTITVQSSLDIMVKATAHVTVDAPLIDIKGQIINIKGTMVNIEGITTTIKGTAMLTAEGAITSVKGTGMLMAESSGLTTVKGGIVMIN